MHRRARLCALEDGRPDSRPPQRALLSENFGRPYGSTDREFYSLLQWLGRPEAPTVGFLTVGGRPAGRPAGLTDPNGYIFLAYKFEGLVIVL